ncbi:MAG: hypothetical protein GX613_07400 [Chloroflexi bacterium]|nr:hypothetical protein [Chloroflexota bacterium]
MNARLDQAAGAFVLIGLGLIFLLDISFWPWIMFVVAIPAFLHGLTEDGTWGGVKGAIWLVGIGVIALLDVWWPGILILIGVSMLAETLVKPSLVEEKAKRKPKRGLPVPDEDEEWI